MTIAEDLAITVEFCGGALMSDAAARIFIAELQAYPGPAVHESLARCRREITGRLSLAHVLERIDDGRPGPEEAWARLPKDEADSAVLTEEMREAMAIVLPLIQIGDLVAARMAFVEPYRRIVSQARASRVPVRWQVSLGHDKVGRESVLRDALESGCISITQAQALGLPAPKNTLPAIAGPVSSNGSASVADLARGIVKQIEQRTARAVMNSHDDALSAADRAHAEGRRCATGCDRCWATGAADEAS